MIISNINSLGLAMDDEGTLYVSDYEKDEVRRYGREDGKEGVIAAGGNGRGAALNQLEEPASVLFSDRGDLYIVDRNNHRIQCFPTGDTSVPVTFGSNRCREFIFQSK